MAVGIVVVLCIGVLLDSQCYPHSQPSVVSDVALVLDSGGSHGR